MAKGTAYMPRAQRTDWGTPAKLFDRLAGLYGPFDLDPCGGPEFYVSQQCARFFTKADDGLNRPWAGRVFVNPPYGPGLMGWVRKCWMESRGGAELVVALLPARTDTRWWQEYVASSIYAGASTRSDIKAAEIHFLPGRLTFSGAPAPATFPSVVIVWKLAPWERRIADAGAEQERLALA